LLADTLARTVGVSADQARVAAGRLLDPLHHPLDYPRQFQKCWHLPPGEFIAEAFNVLLGRPARPDEIDDWVGAVARGCRRIDIVHMFAHSPEARRRGLPTAWLPLIEPVCGPGEFWRPAPPAEPAPVAARPRTLRERLSSSRYFGRLFKYARRVAYLPWNFHKFYHDFANGTHVVRAVTDRQGATEQLIREELLPLVRQLATRQEGLRELLWKKEAAIAAGQNELRAAIDEQVARVAETLSGIAEVIDYPAPELPADLNGLSHISALPDMRRQAG
jgi:hypothetical protein